MVKNQKLIKVDKRRQKRDNDSTQRKEEKLACKGPRPRRTNKRDGKEQKKETK